MSSFLSLADGKHDLLDISKKIGVSYLQTLKIAKKLKKHNLIN